MGSKQRRQIARLRQQVERTENTKRLRSQLRTTTAALDAATSQLLRAVAFCDVHERPHKSGLLGVDFRIDEREAYFQTAYDRHEMASRIAAQIVASLNERIPAQSDVYHVRRRA